MLIHTLALPLCVSNKRWTCPASANDPRFVQLTAWMSVGNRSSGFRESQPPPPPPPPHRMLRRSHWDVPWMHVDQLSSYAYKLALPLCGPDFHVLCLMLFLLSSAAAWALVWVRQAVGTYDDKVMRCCEGDGSWDEMRGCLCVWKLTEKSTRNVVRNIGTIQQGKAGDRGSNKSKWFINEKKSVCPRRELRMSGNESMENSWRFWEW